jgi:hypothetical protein
MLRLPIMSGERPAILRGGFLINKKLFLTDFW